MPPLVRVSMAAGLLLANVACSSLMAEDPRFTGDITRNAVAVLPSETPPPQAAPGPVVEAMPQDLPHAVSQGLSARAGVIEEALDETWYTGSAASSSRTRARAAAEAPAAGQYPDYLASMNRVLDRQNDSARRAVRSMCGGC